MAKTSYLHHSCICIDDMEVLILSICGMIPDLAVAEVSVLSMYDIITNVAETEVLVIYG